MNIRKNIDYSAMYEELDKLMEQQLPQMELYYAIGKAVCQRTEKGAAVMASEYLNRHYPDAKGFSPRSLRRMRDFYRTYENHSVLLSRAMKLGWIQNVVIMEADLTIELREWYMKAAKQFDWSKSELAASIAEKVHEEIILTNEARNVVKQDEHDNNCGIAEDVMDRRYRITRGYWGMNVNACRRRWLITHPPPIIQYLTIFFLEDMKEICRKMEYFKKRVLHYCAYMIIIVNIIQ